MSETEQVKKKIEDFIKNLHMMEVLVGSKTTIRELKDKIKNNKELDTDPRIRSVFKNGLGDNQD